MKKAFARLFLAGALAALAVSPLSAGGKKDVSSGTGPVRLSVGATPVPHAELLELIKDDLAAQGITLNVVEFTDYVAPNTALMAGELDANFFQHIPYLNSNPEWTARLVSAFGVHVEPFGLYSASITDIADLPNGATIAIPNDPTNEGRALLLLAARGLITLRLDAGLEATPLDITDNPRGLQFRELEAAQLPRSLGDVTAAAINGNYALQAGLNPAADALIIEGSESPYVNIVVVQKGRENDPAILALNNALRSQKVRDYIAATWSGSVVAVF
jgi:D-methionine transport system substrate-binding protein